MSRMVGIKNPRKDTGCNCYAYHRPRNTAQLCECVCHIPIRLMSEDKN